MRFRIGLDGIKNRPLGPGDSAVALVVESEKDALLSPNGFQRQQLEQHYERVVLPEKLRLDLEYARTANMLTDLGLLVRTAVALL